MTLILRKDKAFIELVEHFLPTILQYGLVAIAAKSKLNNIGISCFSNDVVLAVVIIIEVCGAELVPVKNNGVTILNKFTYLVKYVLMHL